MTFSCLSFYFLLLLCFLSRILTFINCVNSFLISIQNTFLSLNPIMFTIRRYTKLHNKPNMSFDSPGC